MGKQWPRPGVTACGRASCPVCGPTPDDAYGFLLAVETPDVVEISYRPAPVFEERSWGWLW
jgi:hypothetical protein